MAKNLTRLEKSACIDSFIDTLNATRALIVVASNVTSAQQNGSSLISGFLSGWDVWFRNGFWICEAYDPLYGRWCTREWANTFVDQWVVSFNVTNPDSPKALVDYCLVGDSGDNSQRCGMHYSAFLLPAVCVCTLLESLLIRWTSLKHREKTMLVMGDAIADFLEHRDIAMRDVGTDNTSTTARPSPVIVAETPWVPVPRLPWFNVVSIPTWTASLVL